MFSFKTSVELINVIDDYTTEEIDRLFKVFDIAHLIHPTLGKKSKMDKNNVLLNTLRFPPEKGPFTSSFRKDLLEYIVEDFYRCEDKISSFRITPYEDRFSTKFKALANSLKRDGYIIKGNVIRKILPKTIEESQSEDELFILLDKFNFTITKGHLRQAIDNHSLGNWAGANSQFRPFIESLLIEITNKVLPQNECDSASSAIKLLSKTVTPSFLKEELNEISSANCKSSFVESLWKRLHPEGSHKGLSDESDSTFRYHISIVFAHYLLKRLENR